MHAAKMHHRRDKVLKYLEYAFQAFQRTIWKCVRTGTMDRLFRGYDFSNYQMRDSFGLLANKFKRWQTRKR
jgi:hypothetical protein